MKKVTAMLLTLTMAVGLLAGCGKGEKAQETQGAENTVTENGVQEEKGEFNPADYTITYATCNLNHPVLRIIESGFATACKELGYNYQIVGTEGTDANDMNAAAEAAAAAGSDAILLMAETETSIATVNNLASDYGVKVGVPHVHWEEGTMQGLNFCVACDATSYGKAVADFMAEKLDGKAGTIAVTESRYNEIEDAAAKAFIDRIAELQNEGKLEGVKVLEPAVEGCTDVTESTDVNASIIQANQDIIGAFSTTGNGPLTWSNAARKCGYEPGDICIVSMDYTADNLAELEAGYVTAIVAQPLFQEAYEAAYYFDKLLRGEDVSYWNELEAPLVYKGGTGVNDPATYADILNSVDSVLNEN